MSKGFGTILGYASIITGIVFAIVMGIISNLKGSIALVLSKYSLRKNTASILPTSVRKSSRSNFSFQKIELMRYSEFLVTS